ncbi:MAG: hypothetical protein L6Q47_04335, partial [Ignavibacteriaceae bacterium]|nr:hypothetical protein [Ignavibacteriaceae bacterium]
SEGKRGGFRKIVDCTDSKLRKRLTPQPPLFPKILLPFILRFSADKQFETYYALMEKEGAFGKL